VKSGPGHQILIGGIMKDHLLPQEFEVVDCKLQGAEVLGGRMPRALPLAAHPLPRPLLVGHSVTLTEDNHVVILGGGATCFSMGTYWNRGPYSCKVDIREDFVDSLDYVQTVETAPGVANGNTAGTESQGVAGPKITSISRVLLHSAEEFEKILGSGQPAILRDLDLGSCVANWGLDYIVEKVGAERKVCRISSLTGANC
jgi:tRNA wybutosine-synthesizing protein 4